jgi:AcrR family transcriptional regulator
MAETATTGPRRITPERVAELYEAVLDLLREVGYDALTVKAVAARTQFSKATLYRWWGGKAGLVGGAIRHTRPDPINEIDTGSLRGDLHALVALLDDSTMERNAALVRAVAMAIHHNADLRQAFREQRFEADTAEFRRLLERAVNRGEIRADCPALPHAEHMTFGALIACALVHDQPPNQAFLTSYIDAVVLPALDCPPLLTHPGQS